LCLAATLLLNLAASPAADKNGTPANPTLTEKLCQASQLAAFFPVDPELARQWVPPAWALTLDAQGHATGVLALLHYPDYCLLRTPNSARFEDGENVAPASIVHFWFVVDGPVETIPVPGAQVTTPTAYYYDVADLVTSKLEHSLYRRSGRAALLVSDITFVDLGATQTGEVTFLDGSQITLSASTVLLPVPPGPIRLGGNVWQWHVGGPAPMGDDLGARLEPPSGNPSNVSTTRGQYLGLVPGKPNTTQVTIHADPGTPFADCFGATDVVASRATFFRLNNVVLNWSRGELLWTVSPSAPIPVPPELP
jgi:hypothetical protein